jgi:hypothetical protein
MVLIQKSLVLSGIGVIDFVTITYKKFPSGDLYIRTFNRNPVWSLSYVETDLLAWKWMAARGFIVPEGSPSEEVTLDLKVQW